MKIETEIESHKKNGSRKRVSNVARIHALVVEDEPAMCMLLKDALGAAEISAVILMKSLEALVRLQDEKFDVILVDAGTPSESSTDLVRKIRGSGFNQKTPIIMISDDQRPGALSAGFEAGASFFVYKPIDKAHLVNLIRVAQGTIEQEKRRFRRVNLQARVLIRCGEKTAEGETIDVSLNGTLVRASLTFPPGSTVEVSLFLLAEANPVVGVASVKRVMDGNRMGVQFDRLTVTESARLQEYLLPLIAD